MRKSLCDGCGFGDLRFAIETICDLQFAICDWNRERLLIADSQSQIANRKSQINRTQRNHKINLLRSSSLTTSDSRSRTKSAVIFTRFCSMSGASKLICSKIRSTIV
jgi:hypothetical protein